VGTSSLRRQAQLLRHRPDLVIVGLRGNLDTRIRKLHTEGLDAIVLAAAGVQRLGLARMVTEVLSPDIMLPAIGQGALGIEVQEPGTATESERPSVAELVRVLDDRDTHVALRAERAMLRRLGGGCQVPIAALATVDDSRVFLRGLIARTDGTAVIRGEMRGAASEPETVGRALAEDLLDRGGRAILQDIVGGGVHG